MVAKQEMVFMNNVLNTWVYKIIFLKMLHFTEIYVKSIRNALFLRLCLIMTIFSANLHLVL